MPGELQLTIGTGSVSVPIQLTNAQIRAAMRRFVVRAGKAVAGKTDAEVGEMALRLMLRYAREMSVDQQRAELMEAQRAAAEQTVAADNDLYDEVE